MIEQHLAQANEHVATGERIVARQKVLVAELERGGHDTTAARLLLFEFEQTLKSHIDDRDRILAELRSLTKPED